MPLLLIALLTVLLSTSCTTPPTPQPVTLSTAERYKLLHTQPVSGYVVLHRNTIKFTNLLDARLSANKRAKRLPRPSYARLYRSSPFIVHKVLKDHGDVVEVIHLPFNSYKKHCARGLYSRHGMFYVRGFVPKRDLSAILKHDVTQRFEDNTSYTFKAYTPVARANSPKRLWDFVAITNYIQLPIDISHKDLTLSYDAPSNFETIYPRYNKATKRVEPLKPIISHAKHLSVGGYPIWAKTSSDHIPHPLHVIHNQKDDRVTLQGECLQFKAIYSGPTPKTTQSHGLSGLFGIGMSGSSRHTHVIDAKTPMYWEHNPKKNVTTLEYRRHIKTTSKIGFCFANRIGFGTKRLCVKAKYFKLLCKNTPACKNEQRCRPNDDHSACVK